TTKLESIVVADVDAPGTPTDIYWLASDGSVARQAQVKIKPDAPDDRGPMRWILAFAIPVPAVMTFVYFVFLPQMHVVQGEAPDYQTAAATALADFWPPLLLLCVV